MIQSCRSSKPKLHKKQKNKIWWKTIFNMADRILTPAMWHDHDIDLARWLHPAMWHVPLESWQWIHQVAAPCNVTNSSGIMTLNSPGGSTLQYGSWLWDDMPLNSLKRPPYWNSTSGFDFHYITAVDMSFCTSLRNLSKSDHPRQKKMTSCRFSRWRISAILDFKDPTMGYLKSPCATSYRSSIDTVALHCLLSEKIVCFGILATDRQTDGQHRCTKPLSLSRAAA